jgi:hypothetical protein
MKKSMETGHTAVVQTIKTKTPSLGKRTVPALSDSRAKLFSSIETSPVFNQAAYTERYAFLKKPG